MRNGMYLLSVLSALSLITACHQSLKARDGSARKTQVTYTTVVKNEELLPKCDAGTDGLKAYVSEDDTYIKCTGHSWIRARPGDTHGSFAARSPIRYNEWLDSKLGHRWAVPFSQELAIDKVKGEVCHNGWKLPTSDELRVASINGLFDGIKAHGGISFDKAWTADLKSMKGLSKAAWEAPELNSAKGQDTAGVYCFRPA